MGPSFLCSGSLVPAACLQSFHWALEKAMSPLSRDGLRSRELVPSYTQWMENSTRHHVHLVALLGNQASSHPQKLCKQDQACELSFIMLSHLESISSQKTIDTPFSTIDPAGNCYVVPSRLKVRRPRRPRRPRGADLSALRVFFSHPFDQNICQSPWDVIEKSVL